MSKRSFRTDLLGEPATLRERFTDKGRLRREYGGRNSFQIAPSKTPGEVLIWTIGPMGWWHDFQRVPEGTSFDEALGRTHLPGHLGWGRFTIKVSTGHDFGRDFTTRKEAEQVRDRYAQLYPGIGYTVEEVR